ncbi:hypothetical protein [Bacillus sp. FDAARGOS_1420]|uniref:hypothetical protein n=1 Tax=unclassified Bacillus (in: firmicutes) TaxID=185979 RepID=UPI001C5A7959|nr:hypothetical protein [Bacillus sp. FDAARGOS_1420]MBW3491161.1 hypothetical protein [Bacillus sp. FDAARGOS_1420]
MLENQSVTGNPHDSSRQDFEHYCSDCDGELYFGMTYYEFEGNLICEKCNEKFLERHGTRFVAGE